MLRLRLTLDGDRIMTADPVMGYVSAEAEKLFEAQDTGRSSCSPTGMTGWVNHRRVRRGAGRGAAGRRGGPGECGPGPAGRARPSTSPPVVPGSSPPGVVGRRRCAEAELGPGLRLALRLGLGLRLRSRLRLGLRLEAGAAAARARELLQSIMEEISGGRMHYMFNRVGGLKRSCPRAG